MQIIQKFSSTDGIVTPFTYNPATTTDTLPVAIYKLSFHPMKGFFLVYQKDSFDIPSKLYGNISKQATKVYNTYTSRSGSTGALFVGDKGSGKTTLSKLIANQALANNVPVIIISENFDGMDLSPFLNSLGNTCLFFDEFEKVFNRDLQANLLPLFDGAFSDKRLALVTCNNKYQINEFLLNRPGRLYYKFTFDKVPEDVIIEFCNDHNVPQQVATDLVEIVRRTTEFSIDSLQAIVDEYLRYGESLTDILQTLNIDTNVVNYIFIPTEATHPDYKITKVSANNYDTKGIRIDYKTDEYEDYAYLDISELVYQNGPICCYEGNDFKVMGKWELQTSFQWTHLV